MTAKNKAGFTLPWLTIILLLIIGAVLVWGWILLVYVFALTLLITLFTWLKDKITLLSGRCPDCLAAKEFLQTQHKDWDVWIEPRSHISTETEHSVVAVFYQTPNSNQRPSYKLFSVLHGSNTVAELPAKEQQDYYA
jgi:glutaredoxin